MENIRISADSICDLPKDFVAEHNIPLMPLMIHLGETVVEDVDGTPEKIYAFADKTKQTAKTSARSVGEYTDFFNKHKPTNGTLIHFCISAELSASFQNAQLACNELKNVFVVDSRTLTTGTGLLIIYACELIAAGELSPEEIIAKVTARIPEIQCSFLTKNLTYLHRGGRCSGTSRFLATTLAIRPQIVNRDGKLEPGKKYIGFYDMCLKKYVGDILTKFNNPDLGYCFITHTKMTNEKIVDEIRKQIQTKYEFAHITETIASGTITSHCGPNTLGIIYFNKPA
ncbi:MAG: DegV family protein [Christensenellaceae bacterium]|jgi:DegV family protein with EDD domain|nr:DegV family protein [Christensenellaceae bacterium]